jgi:hypothetical protein
MRPSQYIHVTDAAQISALSAHLGDSYMDREHVSFTPSVGTLEIDLASPPDAQELVSGLTGVLPMRRSVLRIGCVKQVSIDDPQGVGGGYVDELLFDPRRSTITLRATPPLELVVEVESVDIRYELTEDVAGWQEVRHCRWLPFGGLYFGRVLRTDPRAHPRD